MRRVSVCSLLLCFALCIYVANNKYFTLTLECSLLGPYYITLLLSASSSLFYAQLQAMSLRTIIYSVTKVRYTSIVILVLSFSANNHG